MEETMAEEQQEPAAPETADTDQPDNGDLPENLDDHARRYIERLSGETSKRRHAQREAERERDEAREQLEALQRKHESEQDRRDREAEDRGRKAAQAEHEQQLSAVRREALVERIKAKTGGRFADADDVPLYLDVDRLAQEQDAGRRDQQIDKALADLLERKPHLAARQPSGVLISQGGRSQPPDARPRERSWLRG